VATNYSKVLHDVKKTSAGRLHRGRGTAGPFWQHQFWDRFVRHAKEFNERLEYMHLNPVRQGLVARPEEWRWSSYSNFALDRANGVRLPDSDRLCKAARSTSRVGKNPRSGKR
jgi:hypothetical protein